MRQLITSISMVLLTSFTQAAPNAMNDLYSDFQLTRIQLKSKPFTAANFVSQFKAIDQQLQKKYQAYKALEKEELTSKGNQMAYDLELLEPLRTLSLSGLTKDDCQQSLHNNELNYNIEDKQENENIVKIIKAVCRP